MKLANKIALFEPRMYIDYIIQRFKGFRKKSLLDSQNEINYSFSTKLEAFYSRVYTEETNFIFDFLYFSLCELV